jgi:ribosome-binding factor A
MPHLKGSDQAIETMHKIRGVKLVKGSQEAKDFMKSLRDKKKTNKKNL